MRQIKQPVPAQPSPSVIVRNPGDAGPSRPNGRFHRTDKPPRPARADRAGFRELRRTVLSRIATVPSAHAFHPILRSPKSADVNLASSLVASWLHQFTMGDKAKAPCRRTPVRAKRAPTPLARLLRSSTAPERWQSGRSRRTRNAEYAQAYRGFESLPLRQNTCLFNCNHLSFFRNHAPCPNICPKMVFG